MLPIQTEPTSPLICIFDINDDGETAISVDGEVTWLPHLSITTKYME